MKPNWLIEAEKYIGQKEIKGSKHNPLILLWWKLIKRGGIKTDEVPWCAAFTGSMLETVGITSSRFESAKSYLTWGVSLPAPIVGCVVVFEREGGGHVGFVEGQDVSGNLIVLGGNQSDMVKLSAFPRSRVSGYRWPVGFEIPKPIPPLPVVNTVQVSTKES